MKCLGPERTGKSYFAKLVAHEANSPFINLNLSRILKESEDYPDLISNKLNELGKVVIFIKGNKEDFIANEHNQKRAIEFIKTLRNCWGHFLILNMEDFGFDIDSHNKIEFTNPNEKIYMEILKKYAGNLKEKDMNELIKKLKGSSIKEVVKLCKETNNSCLRDNTPVLGMYMNMLKKHEPHNY